MRVFSRLFLACFFVFSGSVTTLAQSLLLNEEWESSPGGSLLAEYNGKIYFSDQNSRIIAVNASDGSSAGSFDIELPTGINNPTFSQLSVEKGKVWIFGKSYVDMNTTRAFVLGIDISSSASSTIMLSQPGWVSECIGAIIEGDSLYALSCGWKGFLASLFEARVTPIDMATGSPGSPIIFQSTERFYPRELIKVDGSFLVVGNFIKRRSGGGADIIEGAVLDASKGFRQVSVVNKRIEGREVRYFSLDELPDGGYILSTQISDPSGGEVDRFGLLIFDDDFNIKNEYISENVANNEDLVAIKIGQDGDVYTVSNLSSGGAFLGISVRRLSSDLSLEWTQNISGLAREARLSECGHLLIAGFGFTIAAISPNGEIDKRGWWGDNATLVGSGCDVYALNANHLVKYSMGQMTTGSEINIPSPERFVLHHNYPNPFNPETTISYSLPTSEYVTLKIYNALGQEIRTLVDGVRPAGEGKVLWNGQDDFGRPVPSGIYYYKIVAGNFSEVMKMTLLK